LLLLLRVHADHRLARGLVHFDLLVDVAELGVPVGMLFAFQGLGRALETEPACLQQPAHRGCRHRMSLPGQLGGQVPQRLRRPAQRRHRVPALIRLDQRHQRGDQMGVDTLGSTPTAAQPPDTPRGHRLGSRFEFGDAPADRGLADPGGPRDQPDASMTE
jgi:hypothetical protein